MSPDTSWSDTFTVQAANCGGDLKDLRVAMSLCPCKVHMSRETLFCVIVVLVYNIYLILIIYQIYGYRYHFSSVCL